MAGALATLEGALGSVKRYGVTEIARSKEWRANLPQEGCIEIVDHADTVGYILSPEYAAELAETTRRLEEQVERASVEAMFAARETYTDLKSGHELADAATALLAGKAAQKAAEGADAR